MLHDYLSRAGIRDASTIHLVTPWRNPSRSRSRRRRPSRVARRAGIAHSHKSRTAWLDPVTKVAQLENGRELPFDLFLGVPVHRAPCRRPRVRPHRGRLDPRRRGHSGHPVPGCLRRGGRDQRARPPAGGHRRRRGVHGRRRAGRPDQGRFGARRFTGEITCYIEMGGDSIAKVNVNFLSGPAPTAVFTPPFAEGRGRTNASSPPHAGGGGSATSPTERTSFECDRCGR